MGTWIIQIYIILLISIAAGQEDDAVIMGERPMVLPMDAVEKAEIAIDEAIFGNESDHMLFLSDDYWPIWLNNSTIA